MSLFPDFDEKHPPPKKREPKPWKMSPTQSRVAAARARRPMSDRELHEFLVDTWSEARPGQTTLAATERAVDGLVRAGFVRDTGRRGQWTHKGREIIWEATTQEATA